MWTCACIIEGEGAGLSVNLWTYNGRGGAGLSVDLCMYNRRGDGLNLDV